MAHKVTIEQRIFCVKETYALNNINQVCRDFENKFGTSVRWHTVKAIIDRFEEHGSVLDKPRTGRPVSATSDDNSSSVREALIQTPRNSLRRLSQELNLTRMSVQQIIRKLGFKLWRPRLVQELSEDDPDRRLQFCELFQDNFAENLNVIWSDEAQFKLNGEINRHNCVFYAEENPHEIFTKSVNSPGVIVWAAICPSRLIGPYFFPDTVNGNSYLHMLETFAFPQIRAGDDAGDMWFQQDGAPPHCATAVRNRLSEEFPRRWIGRRGEMEWPPRSPDLTPMDFAVWGIVKEKVYPGEKK